MRRILLISFLLLLLLPAGVFAADAAPDAANQKQQLDQSQRDAIQQAVAAAAKEQAVVARTLKDKEKDKPFPGTVPPTAQQESAAAPSGKAAPVKRTGKAIYGDIIIHR
jgi:hypothetical protein